MKAYVLTSCGSLGAWFAVGCGGGDEAAGESGSIPAEYADLCADSVGCVAGATPPDLETNYAGEGTTESSTNELWEVGESADFVARLDTSVEGQVSGSFDMAGFDVEVEGAEYRGAGSSFTIFGVDVFEEDECQLEALVVITGTRDEQTGDLSGSLALEFTNVSGAGCDAEELAYPGTRAVFSYTASRLDCNANVQAAQAFVQSAEARACVTDFDCVAEGIGCAKLEGEYCGHIALSAEAAYSDEWSALEDGARACSPNICSVCEALLVPTCQNGLCQ